MRALHEGFAWFVVFANGLVAVWAVAAHWRPPLRARILWWCTVVAQASIFVEGASGVAIDVDDPPRMHQFYGFVAMATVGILYSYVRSYRRQLEANLYLIYGLGGLFLMGLAIRAMTLTAR